MKNKHLPLSDRTDIQTGIEQLKPFSAIAAKLEKDPSTISKEVRRNRVIKENSSTANCEACPLLKKDNISTTSSLPTNFRYPELLSTDTLKKDTSHQNLLISPVS